MPDRVRGRVEPLAAIVDQTGTGKDTGQDDQGREDDEQQAGDPADRHREMMNSIGASALVRYRLEAFVAVLVDAELRSFPTRRSPFGEAGGVVAPMAGEVFARLPNDHLGSVNMQAPNAASAAMRRVIRMGCLRLPADDGRERRRAH